MGCTGMAQLCRAPSTRPPSAAKRPIDSRLNEAMAAVPLGVWVHRAAVVRASAIAGRGLFVTEPVTAGEPLIRLGGRVVTSDELVRLFERASIEDRYVDTIAVDLDAHLVLPPDSRAHYANHSCDPSLWFGRPLELVARRDLAAGTELTIDYGVISDDVTFTMDCTCSATTCRGVVTGRDWQRADLQRTHHGRWPAGLQHRIDTATDGEATRRRAGPRGQ